MHRPGIPWFRLAGTVLAFAIVGLATEAPAQSLEPRAYSSSPIGLNFVLTGFQSSRGALHLDPTVPIEDANADVDMGLIGYLRTLDVAGNLAKFGIVLPYTSMHVDGFVDGDFRERDANGLADPTIFFSYNFHGAPALSVQEFKSYQPEKIIGLTLKVTPPLGDYDSDKLINLSTNRWTIEPGIGISQSLGSWTLEASAAIAFYSDNDDFYNGQTREQDPIYSTQFHVTYTFPNKAWLAASTTFYEGGQTKVGSFEKDDLQENWRTGVTLSFPLNRKNSIKLHGSKGVSTRTGTDFDIAGIAWQYRWGAGI